MPVEERIARYIRAAHHEKNVSSLFRLANVGLSEREQAATEFLKLDLSTHMSFGASGDSFHINYDCNGSSEEQILKEEFGNILKNKFPYCKYYENNNGYFISTHTERHCLPGFNPYEVLLVRVLRANKHSIWTFNKEIEVEVGDIVAFIPTFYHGINSNSVNASVYLHCELTCTNLDLGVMLL
jgi:hypothetical protein